MDYGPSIVLTIINEISKWYSVHALLNLSARTAESLIYYCEYGGRGYFEQKHKYLHVNHYPC